MWMYRPILNISWTDRLSIVCTLQRMQKERQILMTIQKQNLKYLGHVMMNQSYGLLQLMLQSIIEGKRSG